MSTKSSSLTFQSNNVRDLTYEQAVIEHQAEALSEQWLTIGMVRVLGTAGASVVSEMFKTLTEPAYMVRFADRKRAIDRYHRLSGAK